LPDQPAKRELKRLSCLPDHPVKLSRERRLSWLVGQPGLTETVLVPHCLPDYQAKFDEVVGLWGVGWAVYKADIAVFGRTGEIGHGP
jgi:hypothetical protein